MLSQIQQTTQQWHNSKSLTNRNSITPSLAFLTNAESVLIFMPGAAGIAHDATGFGLFATCSSATLHSIRHQPSLEYFDCTSSALKIGLRASAGGKGIPLPNTYGSFLLLKAGDGSRTCRTQKFIDGTYP